MTSMNRQRERHRQHTPLVWWVAGTTGDLFRPCLQPQHHLVDDSYLGGDAGNYYACNVGTLPVGTRRKASRDYYPPTDDNSILNGDHWYRINTSTTSTLTARSEQMLYRRTGRMGRSRVQQLNAQSDGFTYDGLLDVVVHHQHKWRQTDQKFRLRDTRYQNWNNMEEVYEDVFDSYSMDLGTAEKRQLQARLEYSCSSREGYVYTSAVTRTPLLSTTDACAKRGVESVTISVLFGRYHPRTGQHMTTSAVSAAVRSMPGKECAMDKRIRKPISTIGTGREGT